MIDETLWLHMASVVTCAGVHVTSNLPLEHMFENERAVKHVNMPNQICLMLYEATVPCVVVSDEGIKSLGRLLRNGKTVADRLSKYSL
jgi:hypothetical protein